MILSNSEIEQLARLGIEAALAAGKYISSQMGGKHDINKKSTGKSLASQVVTAIDIKSQEIIIDKLKDSIRFFDLGVLSEEVQDDQSRFEKEYFWCIDPLDGTLPFTEQQYGFAVSIALVQKSGQSVVGAVVDPFSGDYYLAIKGKGCIKNGKPIKVELINTNRLICHFDRSFLQSPNHSSLVHQLNQIRKRIGLKDLQINTGAGSVMNALGLLISSYGCYVKLPKKSIGGGCIWDFAATSLIFNELGLYVSDCFGNPLKLNKRNTFYMNNEGILFSTNGQLQKELIELNKIDS